MDKSITPPSGDRHDYMSQAPYWWPDPSKPDGKPYIRKDGQRNPEISKITDRDNLGRLGDAVTTLSLAYAYTGREQYATHAARLVRVWFLDPATRMNPHLQFGQDIPGINQGRGIGIIETRNLPELLDGVMLIAGSPAWTKADEDGLQGWMQAYLTWLVESTHGREESKNGNNHETCATTCRSQAWRSTRDNRTSRAGRSKAHAPALRPRSSPTAVSRASSNARSPGTTAGSTSPRSWSSRRSGERVGVDLWHYRDRGRPQHPASRGLPDPLRHGERPWTYDQITPFERQHVAPDPAPRRGGLARAQIPGAGGPDRRRQPEADL